MRIAVRRARKFKIKTREDADFVASLLSESIFDHCRKCGVWHIGGAEYFEGSWCDKNCDKKVPSRIRKADLLIKEWNL